LAGLRINFNAALDPGTVAADAVTILGDGIGDVSQRIGSATLSGDGTALTIALSQPLSEIDWYTVALSDSLRTDAGAELVGDTDIRLGVLPADADGSAAVTWSDLLAIRSRAGQAVAADTARFDIDRSGQITGTDLQAVQRRHGGSLP
jgi:hypothetical protein